MRKIDDAVATAIAKKETLSNIMDYFEGFVY